jgi:hypothetical protein
VPEWLQITMIMTLEYTVLIWINSQFN